MNELFDNIKHIDESGQAYWSARELCAVIGYADYRNFSKVIDKAKILCAQNKKNIEDHFVEVNEMLSIGSGAKRNQKSSVVQKKWITALEARLKAYEEYDKFRVIQDREFLSDFDKEVLRLKKEIDLFDSDDEANQ